MRLAMGVEYDGSNYFGFQAQVFDKLPTIQEKLEEAISAVADHKISIVPAGRTDAGVHATNQVIHFDTDAVREDRAWILGTNTNLPHDIAIKWVKRVPDDFHARFSAISRKYQYLILNSTIRSPILHKRATLVYQKLDEVNMNRAAQYFLGEHDFSAFRAAQCQSKTPIRKVNYCKVERHGNYVIFEIEANAFLHHMVRNMVGVLLEIGSGKKEISWAKEVLESKNRTVAGITAPPDGLYFVNVNY